MINLNFTFLYEVEYNSCLLLNLLVSIISPGLHSIQLTLKAAAAKQL